jgi:hypothetical protein
MAIGMPVSEKYTIGVMENGRNQQRAAGEGRAELDRVFNHIRYGFTLRISNYMRLQQYLSSFFEKIPKYSQ